MTQDHSIKTAIVADSAPLALEPLAPAGTLTDRVTQILLRKIEGGEFAPGTQLPTEQVMVQGFGVSRTVIREAVSRLKSEGLVEMRRGSGAFVRERRAPPAFRLELDARDSLAAVLRVIELRRCLEADSAALAAERRSEAQLANIKHRLKAIQKAEQAGEEAVDEDLAFHAAIALATGNPHYTALLNFLGQHLHVAIRVTRTNEARREDFRREVKREHEAIVDAIARKDAEAARAAATHHMQNAARRLKAADWDFWVSPGGEAARKLAEAEPQEPAPKRRPRG